jgi:hypothetical protein
MCEWAKMCEWANMWDVAQASTDSEMSVPGFLGSFADLEEEEEERSVAQRTVPCNTQRVVQHRTRGAA